MDDVWREQDTTPTRIETALRKMFVSRFKEAVSYTHLTLPTNREV